LILNLSFKSVPKDCVAVSDIIDNP
jgi:hypothetical protein